MKILKNGTKVLFAGMILQINRYSRTYNTYVLGSDSVNVAQEPEHAFKIINTEQEYFLPIKKMFVSKAKAAIAKAEGN